MDAWKDGAQDQLQGQIASAKIPLSRMISPQLYWVMTDNDFTLDINNPEDPRILCAGNNPDRQNNLSRGMFVGAVADNFDERIEQKIVIDREKLAGETPSYVPIPEISSFGDADGADRMEEIIRRNYRADQGGRYADHKTGTQTHRRRPCAAASVGKEIGGSTSPPISVYPGRPPRKRKLKSAIPRFGGSVRKM